MRTDQHIWSVTEITSAIRDRLESAFPLLAVEGEVSNCRASGAGHLYFTLKDSKSAISAVLFRGRSSRVSLDLSNGMQVVARGKIDVYAPRGSYQIIVDSMREVGRGMLLEELEKRKHRLGAEGLFDQERKKNLPPYPRRVAVVSSPTGSAIQDILRVLSRRVAAPRITVLPTSVQGSEAPTTIAAQLSRAAAYNLGDVLILARGGGSWEDLMAFNEEVVVRAIAACSLPVICGIGHETDVTLADLAADVRAATPSAAAELVSDRSEDLLLRTRGFRQNATTMLSVRMEASRSALLSCGAGELTRRARGRLDEALRRSDEACRELRQGAVQLLGKAGKRLQDAVRLLELSPQAMLARGYAEVFRGEERVVDAAQLGVGDRVSLKLARGRAGAQITEVENTG